MCYSKEVTFTVGTIMTAGCLYMWQRYVRNNPNTILKETYSYLIIGYFCVALHQYMESFSVAFSNASIYKIGLVASLSCMFFYMKSLEKLSHLKFGSTVVGLLILFFTIPVYLTDLKFENHHFWVRGKEDGTFLLWSGLWMTFFIYWNVCIFYFRSLIPSAVNKKILIYYSLFSISISYLLYISYGYLSLYIQTLPSGNPIKFDIFTSFDMVLDSPSIWCVFSVLHVILLPCLFRLMDKKYNTLVKTPLLSLTPLTYLMLCTVTFALWMAILEGLPMLFAVAYKMVTG